MVTGRSADWCQPFLNHYHTRVIDHLTPWGLGMELQGGKDEEKRQQSQCPLLTFCTKGRGGFGEKHPGPVPPPQAKSFWSWGTGLNLKGPFPGHEGMSGSVSTE